MVGRIVLSAAGRDRGRFMVVVGEKDGYPLVCDGKERPKERPKRKNPKHLKFTNAFLEYEASMSNKTLRQELKSFAERN